ncbi:MAG TPA: hypothetical protein VIE68_06650 [Gemmatimonadota bacterium]|jgi:hypothetical protein
MHLNDGRLQIQGFGATVQVRAPAWVESASLSGWVAPEVDTVAGGRAPVDIELSESGGSILLRVGRRRFGPYTKRESALRGLASGIHFVLGMRSPMTFIHAAAVEIDGAAFVFPGDSGWGKSTLARRLVEDGCGYLSDEYAVLSPDGAVLPLSKPIRIRGEESPTYLRPGGVSAPDGIPCGAFVLTRFVPGARWNPEPVTPGVAILECLRSTLRSRRDPQGSLQALLLAAGGALCIRSDRGEDPEPVADTLRALARGVPSRGRPSPNAGLHIARDPRESGTRERSGGPPSTAFVPPLRVVVS